MKPQMIFMSTKNFDKFSLYENNREVDKKHVAKLEREFAEYGYNYAFPIVVVIKRQ